MCILELETARLRLSITFSNTTPVKHFILWATSSMRGRYNKTNGDGNKVIPM
jgi:hypothetical protein